MKIIVFSIKFLLFGYFGLWLGLGNYDPDSTLFYQSWKVYVFLYLPLAMGIESLVAAAAEAYVEGKSKE